MQVKKQQLDPDMEQWTGSKLGKEYIKAVYCHSTYLTYFSLEEKTCYLLSDIFVYCLPSLLEYQLLDGRALCLIYSLLHPQTRTQYSINVFF